MAKSEIDQTEHEGDYSSAPSFPLIEKLADFNTRQNRSLARGGIAILVGLFELTRGHKVTGSVIGALGLITVYENIIQEAPISVADSKTQQETTFRQKLLERISSARDSSRRTITGLTRPQRFEF